MTEQAEATRPQQQDGYAQGQAMPGTFAHQGGSLAPQQSSETTDQKRGDRLLQLAQQLTAMGAPSDPGLQAMLAEYAAMEAAYLFADQMSYSETVLPEYRRSHRPSKGRGNQKTYGNELGKQAAINGAAAIMFGRAVGIGMTQSLQLIHNINGKSGLDARTMQALCETKGQVQFMFDPDNDHSSATVSATRPGHNPVRCTWTMQHASVRGYTNNPLYTSHPDEMLRAKALTECCRLIAADIVLGLDISYEELQLEPGLAVQVPIDDKKPPVPGGLAGFGAHVAQNGTQQPKATQEYGQWSGAQAGPHGTGDWAHAPDEAYAEAFSHYPKGADNDWTAEADAAPPPKPAKRCDPATCDDPAHAQGHAMAAAEDRRTRQDFGLPPEAEPRATAPDLPGEPETPEPEAEPETPGDEPAPQDDTSASPAEAHDPPDEHGLTVLHTALGKAGFEHRSQRLGVVAAFLGRDITTTKELTNSELGMVNHQLQLWARAGTVRDNCIALMRGDAPADDADGTARATTKELASLRKACRDHLKITGAALLPFLSQTLGWDVDDVNKLSSDDVHEAIKVAEGKAERG